MSHPRHGFVELNNLSTRPPFLRATVEVLKHTSITVFAVLVDLRRQPQSESIAVVGEKSATPTVGGVPNVL